MENISELLKEARPLYFRRKKNRLILKTMLCTFIPVILFSGFLTYNSFNQKGAYLASNEQSVIAQMGFDVDEYGLLKVD